MEKATNYLNFFVGMPSISEQTKSKQMYYEKHCIEVLPHSLEFILLKNPRQCAYQYIRTSSAGQSDFIEKQIKVNEEFCRKNGIYILKTFIDENKTDYGAMWEECHFLTSYDRPNYILWSEFLEAVPTTLEKDCNYEARSQRDFSIRYLPQTIY